MAVVFEEVEAPEFTGEKCWQCPHPLHGLKDCEQLIDKPREPGHSATGLMSLCLCPGDYDQMREAWEADRADEQYHDGREAFYES